MDTAVVDPAPPTGRRAAHHPLVWWAVLLAIAVVGLIGRVWGVDFDSRQHQHPDERHWSLVSAGLARADAGTQRAGRPTPVGAVVDWLDADVSPANPYRVSESFVYGPAPLAWARGVAGWLGHGVATGAQPASALAHAIDALGVPLIDDQGRARFDDAYQVDLVGRLLSAVYDTVTIVVVGLLARRLAGRLGCGAPRAAGWVAAAMYAAAPTAIQQAHFMSSESALGLACALLLLVTVDIDRGPSVRRAAAGGAALGVLVGIVVAVKLSGTAVAAIPVAGCVWLVWRFRRRADAVRLAVAALTAAIAYRAFHPAAFDGLGLGLSDVFTADFDRVRHQFDQDWPPAIQWAGNSGAGVAARWLVQFCFGPGLCVAALAGVVWLWSRWRRGDLTGARWPAAATVAAAIVPFAYVVVSAVPSGRYFMPMLPAVAALSGLGVVVAWNTVAHPAATRVVARAGAVALVAVGVLWGVMFVHGVYGSGYTRAEASRWIAEHVEPGAVLSNQAWDDALPLAIDGVDPQAYGSVELELVGTDSVDKLLRTVSRIEQIDYVVESSPRLWGSVVRMPHRFPSTIRFFAGLDDGTLGFERVATFDRDPRLGPLRLDDDSAEEAFSVYDHPEVRIWRKVREVPRAELIAALDPVAAANAVTVTHLDAAAGGLLLTDSERERLADGPTWSAAFSGGPGWVHALAWLALVELLGLAAFVLLHPLLRSLPDAGWGIAKPLGLVVPAVALFVADEWLGLPLGRPLAGVVLVGFLALAGWRLVLTRSALSAWIRQRWRITVVVETIALGAFVAMLAYRAANPDLWHMWHSGEKPFEMAYLSAVLRSPGLPPYDPWYSGGVMNYYYGGALMLLAPARLMATSPGLVFNIGLAVFASCAASACAGFGALLADRRRAAWGAVGGFAVLLGTNVAVVGAAWRRLRGETIEFDWWSVSRVVPGSNDITEFPAWSWMFADLHAHVMAICLVVAALVLFVVVFEQVRSGRWTTAAAGGALVGVLAGLVRATNTWDYPLVFAGTLMVPVAAGWAAGGRAWRTSPAWRRAGLAAVTALLAGRVVWWPYVRRGQVFDSGFHPADRHTPLGSWLTQWGWFAALITLALAATWWPTARRVSWRSRRRAMSAAGAVSVAAGLLLLWPWAVVALVAGLLAAACSATAWARRRERVALAWLTAAVGWLIQTGVELVTIDNDVGRMNTVFKFWFESWLLVGAGSAALVVRLLTVRSWVRWPTRVVVGGAALAAVAFWALAIPVRVGERVSAGGWTLDGERYLTDPTPHAQTAWRDQTFRPADDVPLVEWLRREAPGGSVVAEVGGEDYQWTGRFTWLTGLPTPSGWRFHSEQQRRAYGAEVNARNADLHDLYTTDDPAEVTRILASHRIDIVTFGTVESILARDSAPALADADCLTVELRSGKFWIARVDRACIERRWVEVLVARVPSDGAAG